MWIVVAIGLTFLHDKLENHATEYIDKDTARLLILMPMIFLMFLLQKEKARKVNIVNMAFMMTFGVALSVLEILMASRTAIRLEVPDIPLHVHVNHALAAALIVPIHEEEICRGLLLRDVGMLSGKWIAIVSTSLLFRMAHVNDRIMAFIFALISAWMTCHRNVEIRERAAFHGAHNLANFAFIIACLHLH